MKKQNGFKRISNGYGCPSDYIGFGYYLEKVQDFDGNASWEVFELAKLNKFSDGSYDTMAQPAKTFDNLKEAKDWCKNFQK